MFMHDACNDGPECRYAHNTEEMAYHPMMYKYAVSPAG
jgi:hypothetical protein